MARLAGMRNLSPNQFALPGMEAHAHPLAPYVAAGFQFHEREELVGHREPGYWMARHTHRLGATHPQAEGHGTPSLSFPGDMTHAVAELHWRGEHHEEGYPGEVEWVGRHSYEPRSSSGITDAMHAFASLGGKSTVPVHSPDRSDAGDEWSARVGPAHLRPPSSNEVENSYEGDDEAYQEHYDEWQNWQPPAGIHPYERGHGAAPRSLSPGQFHLAGVEPESKWGEQTGVGRRAALEGEYHEDRPYVPKVKRRAGYPNPMPERPKNAPPSFA